jgi:hypothetical protein
MIIACWNSIVTVINNLPLSSFFLGVGGGGGVDSI